MKLRRLVSIPAFALSLALWVGSANAQVILTLNDLTESPTVSAGGLPVNQVGPEDFIVVVPNAVPTNTSTFSAFTLTEPAGGGVPAGSVSDIVYFTTVPDSSALRVEFISDAEGVPLTVSPLATLYGSVVENGTLQSIPLPPGIANAPVSVSAASDIIADPEPTPITLAGVGGLFGLGCWTYRRRKAPVT